MELDSVIELNNFKEKILLDYTIFTNKYKRRITNYKKTLKTIKEIEELEEIKEIGEIKKIKKKIFKNNNLIKKKSFIPSIFNNSILYKMYREPLVIIKDILIVENDLDFLEDPNFRPRRELS